MKMPGDMNLPLRSVSLLNNSGFEAALWSAIRPANAPDTEIMAFSTEKEYVVLPRDLDFVSILAAMVGEKSSVLPVDAEDVGTNAIGTNGVVALRQMWAAQESGVGIRRSRIPAAGGGTVRPTASGGQR